jgi:hypothetical protein
MKHHKSLKSFVFGANGKTTLNCDVWINFLLKISFERPKRSEENEMKCGASNEHVEREEKTF